MRKQPNTYKQGNRRGYYIYGKDFFILPNRLWTKTSENDRVVFSLAGSEVSVSIGRDYLIPTVREPSDCAYEIHPRLSFYALSIPDRPLTSLPADLRTYINHSRKLLGDEEISAIALYESTKKRWYSHIHYVLREPFGSIVIPEKFRPYQRGAAAHYIDMAKKRVAVPVTFYTRSAGSPSKDVAVVAWLNSTIGLAFRYKDRAWLGTASERMSGEQLDAMEVIDVSELSLVDLSKLSNHLSKLPSALPDFEEQLNEPFYSESGRSDLDCFVLEMLGVKETKIEHYQKRCIAIVKEWIKTIKALNEP
jgi:hypothetical protein